MNPRLLLALASPGLVVDGILTSLGQGGGGWNEEQGLRSLGLQILFVTKIYIHQTVPGPYATRFSVDVPSVIG